MSENNDTNWGKVELWRHQYGELPKENDERRLVYPEAFRKAASAVSAGKVSPFNASEMLKSAGSKIADLEARLTRLRDELREAMGTLKVIGRPACPYPGTQREACGRCSTCLARAFLEKHGVGE